MKKLSRMLLVLLMSFALSACGSAAPQGSEPSGSGLEQIGSGAVAEERAIAVEEEAPSDDAGPSEGAGDEDGEVPPESAVPPESSAPSGSAGDGEDEGAAPDESRDGDEGLSESGADGPLGSEGASSEGTEAGEEPLPEDGTYTTKEDVALYIYLYGKLPDNFITKKDAEKLGWEGGSLEPYAPGKCIGGNRFGNYEGLLPEAEGRVYTECDIDTLGARKRGAKRIVFSNDGLIYYTEDHYESFELLYGEE